MRTISTFAIQIRGETKNSETPPAVPTDVTGEFVKLPDPSATLLLRVFAQILFKRPPPTRTCRPLWCSWAIQGLTISPLNCLEFGLLLFLSSLSISVRRFTARRPACRS